MLRYSRTSLAIVVLIVASGASWVGATPAQQKELERLTLRTNEANQRVVEAALQALNRGDDEGFLEALSPSHRWRVLSEEAPAPGRAGARLRIAELRKAFPGFRIEPRRWIMGRGFVAVQGALVGKQDGPYLKQPATGRQVGVEVLYLAFVGDGRIAQSLLAFSSQQLGLQLANKAAPVRATKTATKAILPGARASTQTLGELREAARLGFGLHVAAAGGHKAAQDSAFAPLALPATAALRTSALAPFRAAAEPVLELDDVLTAEGFMISPFTASGAGRKVPTEGVLVARVANGKVTEAQTYVDLK